MNTTVISDQPNVDGLGYTLGLCLGILLTLVIITYTSYMCIRVPVEADETHMSTIHDFATTVSIQQLGLDEVTLSSFPHLTYSNRKADDDDDSAACSICLADYADGDLLRLLPDCRHYFHLKCVDPWLLLHPTCPVCRFSPLADINYATVNALQQHV